MSCFRPITAWQHNSAYIDCERQSILYWAGLESRKLVFKEPKDLKGWRELKVPCGKCIGCLLDKANDWATRCYCEMKNWENNCFITLTYDDDNIPKNRQLRKKDLQDFWKRLRYYEQGMEQWENPRTSKIEKPIRYLVCGEYGPTTLRPHYHAIVFNWKPKDLKFYKYNKSNQPLYTSKKLNKIWGKGFVIIGNANYQSACYVSRYVTKKLYKSATADIQIAKEFIETSRNGGIGIMKWLKEKWEIIKNQGIYTKVGDSVKLKKIPKYFLRKWKEETPICENPETFMKFKYMLAKQGLKAWKELLSKTTLNESEYLKQLEENTRKRTKNLRRDNIK